MTIMKPTRITSAFEAVRYMLGGRAYVTLISNKTNRQFLYKIIAYNAGESKYHVVWAHVNNTWRHVGVLTKEGSHFCRKHNSIPSEWGVFKAFVWAWGNIYNKRMPPFLCIYHNNTCCRCNKPLFDSKSIKRGVCPACIKRSSIN